MTNRSIAGAAMLAVASWGLNGCATRLEVSGSGGDSGAAGVVSDVASKAIEVARQVGGAGGFGGMLMDGYVEHAPSGMGFNASNDLASSNGVLSIRVDNQWGEDCACHISYVASYMGLEELTIDVDVAAGEQVTVELPCPEIVGLGPLETPGAAGCHLAGGEPVPNTMVVPGFLGLDYACGSAYEHFLGPDIADLDGDGDTEELIIQSQAMQLHMGNGGPMGHGHGGGPGMMGPHMGM